LLAQASNMDGRQEARSGILLGERAFDFARETAQPSSASRSLAMTEKSSRVVVSPLISP
jgi:hypothetical protein